MRKILPFMVVGILILSGFGAVAINSDNDKLEFKIIEDRNMGDRGIEYTHTILGEFGTATWCHYCTFAHGALENIYGGQWHPFYYTALVCDVNTHAEQRAINELGLSGYPTVYFDGGYKQNVGAGDVPGAQSAYNSSIVDCGERDVADVDIDLDVTWNGNAEMYIEVSVDNNEGSEYDGHIHVYVTELTTSMGWLDNDGVPYNFPFLDYAFNKDIAVSSGGIWTDSITWDGHDYNNGYGDDFSSISYGNIMIIGAVFDDDDYVDDVTGYRVGDNDSPNTPSSPDPDDGDTNVDTDAVLSWKCKDPDLDVLSYDIYFGESSNPPLVASDIVGRTYDPGPLDLDTTYYWKIVAKDEMGGTTAGPVWDFTTRGNDPPNDPSNPDPYNGETGVYINTDVSWTCSDPDGDDISYDVYFGTSSPPPKVMDHQTGTSYDPPGVLDFSTEYYWQIVAWDEYNYSTVGSIWSFTTEENTQPYTPSNPDPEDGATDVGINILIKWTGGDPNPGDTVRYDLYFGTSSPPPLEAEDLMQAAYDPGTMELDTVYYWKIISEDSQGLITEGPIWHFTTELEPTYPPDAPDIDGPLTGDPGTSYDYKFNSVDPDGDNVKYYVDWGDGSTDETGFNTEGTDMTIPHTYASSGKYTITAYAEDATGKTSPTSTFQTTMPKEKTIPNILQIILERYPNAVLILRIILGL